MVHTGKILWAPMLGKKQLHWNLFAYLAEDSWKIANTYMFVVVTFMWASSKNGERQIVLEIVRCSTYPWTLWHTPSNKSWILKPKKLRGTPSWWSSPWLNSWNFFGFNHQALDLWYLSRFPEIRGAIGKYKIHFYFQIIITLSLVKLQPRYVGIPNWRVFFSWKKWLF